MAEVYKALTRKYRPRSFDDIVSQSHVSETLKNAISQNRLSHAYLFCGPRGVGKTTMARVLARTVNEVDESVDGEELSNTLNIFEMDAASHNKVEDVHSLRERVRIPPQTGRYKIYIIDEVHMLSKSAFNALLKTLEEPPDHAIFIFATTEPHKVLPTIISRCQRYDFRRISVDEIVDHLRDISQKENINIDDESLHVIAKKADGALRDALGVLDQAVAFCGTNITHDELHKALNVVSTERLFDLTDAIIKQDATAGLQLINELIQEGYDIQEFLAGLTEHLRNLYLSKDVANHQMIESTEDQRKRFAETANAFSTDDLMRMLHIVSEAQFKIREAQQPRILLEVTLLKLFHMTRTDGLRELMKELRELKASGVSGKAQSVETPSSTQKAQPEPKQAEEPEPTGKVEEPKSPEPQKTAEPDKPSDSQKSEPASPKPEPAPSKSEPSSAPPPSEPKDDGEIDLFGKPSLGRPKNMSSVDLGGTASPQNADSEDHDTQTGQINGSLAVATEPKVDYQKQVYFHDVEQNWDRFLEMIKSEEGHTTYFTVRQAVPVELEEGCVWVECKDGFTHEIIRQKKREFGRILSRCFQCHLTIDCKLVETKPDAQSLDPYTRFRKLQQKDPKLRAIVELFGAELDM